MVIEILLIISVVLQIVAAIVAIGLIRRTKYNLSWMLFTVALTCMAFMRLAEYVQITSLKTILRLPPEFFVWMGVVTSLCVALGMLLVKRIFNYIASTENQRRISERRILNTVLRTEEKERLRFSKDLHDGLGPLLSSAKMSVSALAADKTDERSREILRNASYVIDEAIRSLREISVNLSPHILKDFGLARAVSNFIGRLPHSGMQIHFSTNLHAERFDAVIREELGEAPLTPSLKIDAEMPFSQASDFTVLKGLELLQPFGIGNPEPIFASLPLRVKKRKAFGHSREHISLEVTEEGSGITLQAKAWRQADQIPESIQGQRIRLAYTPGINAYNGIASVELRVRDWEVL